MPRPESETEKVIEIGEDIKPDVAPYDREIECGCSGESVLVYGRLNHTTYTLRNERVIVRNIWAYECKECGMVAYPTSVSDKLYEKIKDARIAQSI